MPEISPDPLVALVARERRRINQARQTLRQTSVGARREARRAKRYAPELAEDVEDVGAEARNLRRRYSGQQFEETPFVGSGSFLSKVGNALGTPARFVTSGLHELLYDKSEKSALEAAGEGAYYPSRGKLGGDIFQEAGVPRGLSAALGFGADLLLDPTTLVGGAAVKAAGRGLSALGKVPKVRGALETIKGSRLGRAARYAFKPGARLEDMGLETPLPAEHLLAEAAGRGKRFLESKRAGAKPQALKALAAGDKSDIDTLIKSYKESPYAVVRNAQLALPSAVAKGHSQLLKDLEGMKPQNFKGFADVKALGREAAQAKKLKVAPTALQQEAKTALKHGFKDPELQKTRDFYDRYKRYMKKGSRERAEYERVWEDIAGAKDKTQEGLAKSRLGEHIMRALTQAEERRFAQSISGVKLADGSPLVWKRGPKKLDASGKELPSPKPPLGYVRLSSKRRKIFGPGAYVPRLFADELRDMPHLGDLRGFAKAMSEGSLGRAWDRMTGRWKAVVTGLNPGFNVRNFLSNQHNIFQAEGVSAISLPKILRGDSIRRGASGTVVGAGGKKLSYDEVRQHLLDAGVYRTGQVSEDIDRVLRDVLEGKVGQFEHKLIENVHGIPGLKNIAGRMAGDAIEDAAKTQLFVEVFEKTGDVQKALDRVRKILFDYGDLTYFERHYAKRLIPFYTWMRKNTPLQIEFLLRNPGRYSSVFKLQQELPIATLPPEERRLEKSQLKSEGIEQRMGVPITKEAGGYRYALPGFLPLGEVGDVTDPVGALSQRMHPLLGAAFDRFVRGRESFRDIPFYSEEGLPTEVRASPQAAALENMGLDLPGTRPLRGKRGAAGLPEVRQTLTSQKLEQLLPMLLANIPVAGLPAAALAGSSWGRSAAGALYPQGSSQWWDAAMRFAGLPMAVSEPSSPLRAESYDLQQKLRALAARRKAAEGR